MKKISYWAKRNQKKAWLLITLCHLILIYLAFQLSHLFLQAGVEFNAIAFFTVLVFFVPLALFYPSKKKYAVRKTFDLVITGQGFILLFILFNTSFLHKEHYGSGYAAIGHLDSINYKYKESQKILAEFQNTHQKLSRKNARTLRKELNYQSKKWMKEPDKENNGTLKIIAIILLALVASTFILFLACGIGCAGAEVLAGIVAVVGFAGVIWLTIILIKGVNKKRRKNQVLNQTS